MTELQIMINEQDILEKANLVIDTIYDACAYPPNAVLTIEAILGAIEQITQCQIVRCGIEEASMPKLRGVLYRFKSGQAFLDQAPISAKQINNPNAFKEIHPDKPVALILTSDVNNPCWHRFTVVKEACHLLIEGDRLSQLRNVSELALAITSANLGMDESKRVLKNREDAAESLAIEIFLSDRRIKDWIANLAAVRGLSPWQIADKLKVPKRFVESKMDQWKIPFTKD